MTKRQWKRESSQCGAFKLVGVALVVFLLLVGTSSTQSALVFAQGDKATLADDHQGAAERVNVLPYQLRGIRPVSSYSTLGTASMSPPPPSHPVGPWPFGSSKEEDRAFYQKEDARQVEWERWRTLLLLEEEAERKRMANAQQENAKQGNGSATGPTLSKLSMNSNFAKKDSFSDRNAARRTMEVLRVVGKNTTTLEKKYSKLYQLVSQLSDLIQASDVYPETALADNTTLESRYKWLSETVFAHAMIPPTPREGSSAVVSSASLFKALPAVMLMDEAVIEAVERETQSLRYNLKIAKVMPTAAAPPTASASDASAPVEDNEAKRKIEQARLLTQIEAALFPIEQMAKDSKRALTLVEELSYPYLERVQGFVSSTIDRIEKELLHNDEATEAKRQQSKELLKEKAGLLALQHQLIQTGNDIAKARYRDKQISAHSFIVGLSLLAKFRFHQPSGFEDLDALPFTVEDSIPSLGLLHKEFNTFLFFPLSLSVIVTVTALLLVDEVRRFTINYAMRVTSEAKRKKAKPSVSKKSVRIVLRLLIFLKIVWCLLPPIALLVYFNWKGPVTFYWAGFFAMATMSVRLSFVGVVTVYVSAVTGTTFVALAVRDVAAPLPKVVSVADKKAKED